MGLDGRLLFVLLLGMVISACIPAGENHATPVPLERYLEVELGRLEETYRLLDRFAPGWKRDFFQKKGSLDELTADLLDMSPVEKKAVASRLSGRYSYDELFAKHASVIKEKAKSKKGS
jgi:hypothetical protein